MILRKLGKLNFNPSQLILIMGLLFYAFALNIHSHFSKPNIVINKQDSAVNINTLFLKLFAAGNKRLIADTIWIQTLIESDTERYSGKDFGNWMYLRFLSISELDPMFYENYLYGGQYLSIIKDDLHGAALIYEKGLKYFPDDFNLNLNGGFNYYFEMGDYENGLKLLERIQHHPKAPVQIPSIVNKLKIEIGEDPKLIYLILVERYNQTRDELLKEKLKSDLYVLKAEIDLKCLNDKEIGCSSVDLNGDPYVLKDGMYISRTPFISYRIKKRIRKGEK